MYAASFLILPLCVYKLKLATTNNFYLDDFADFTCFCSSVSPDLRV